MAELLIRHPSYKKARYVAHLIKLLLGLLQVPLVRKGRVFRVGFHQLFNPCDKTAATLSVELRSLFGHSIETG